MESTKLTAFTVVGIPEKTNGVSSDSRDGDKAGVDSSVTQVRSSRPSLSRCPWRPPWRKGQQKTTRVAAECRAASVSAGKGVLTSSDTETNVHLKSLLASPQQPQQGDGGGGPPELSPVTGEREDGEPAAEEGYKREVWEKKGDFLLSIIGYAVDLATIWRFPYLCYKNGGGAFLIPYFIMLIFVSLPIFFMELLLGQFHRESALTVWKIAPIFKGIGLCQCVIAIYVAFYYNVIIAWACYYFVSSLTLTLPWTHCSHSWNSERCMNSSNATNVTMARADDLDVTNKSVSSAAEFFERGVLGVHLSDGVGDIGGIRWPLVVCLLFVFTVIYFSLWKGVHTSGKVVWVTATMPYIILTILLVRGVMLPGSAEGVKYFIIPRPDRLLDAHVWIDAAVQICYSVGAGFGVHIAFASYNKFHSNCYRDAMVTVSINAFTSVFSGFVVFAYLGYIAFKSDLPIDKVVAEGPGLVFIVYPEAIATLPASFIWSMMFFIMLFTLGIDSAMGGLESPLSGIRDELREMKHWFSRHRYSRELITLVVVIVCFLLSLPQVTAGGGYLVQFWDKYAAGTAILFGIFMEAVAVSWFYGLDNFCADFEKMLRFRPNLFWRLCWKFISPAVLLAVILSSMIMHTNLTYWTYAFGPYEFPTWASVLGWTISISSMLLVPAFAIYKLYSTPGSFTQRVALAISPRWEHQAIVQNRQVKRFKGRFRKA